MKSIVCHESRSQRGEETVERRGISISPPVTVTSSLSTIYHPPHPHKGPLVTPGPRGLEEGEREELKMDGKNGPKKN
jgi:hypothetical protein